MSTNIKFSKYQISTIMQYGEFLGSLSSKKAGTLVEIVSHWRKVFQLH